MKLRNKKTGKIKDIEFNSLVSGDADCCVLTKGKPEIYIYTSLAELNEEWEDAPEEPKEYWFINSVGGVIQPSDTTDWEQQDATHHKEIGNYFGTREEAEKAVEKLKAWKRLKDKGISFEAKVIDRKWYLEPKTEPRQRTFDEVNAAFKDIMFIFGGEE